MMKTYLILFAMAIAFCSGCKKNDNTTNAPTTVNTGILRFTNNSSNPYSLYIDGVQVTTIDGHLSWSTSKSPGTYTYKVQQQSGYAVYPTIIESGAQVFKDKTTVVNFP